jgi:hypothetical protein
MVTTSDELRSRANGVCTAESGNSSVYYNPRLDPKNYLDDSLSWNPATRLRQMLARPGIVVAPGVCDGISARCAIEAGFNCMYQRYTVIDFPFLNLEHNLYSGAATTASRLGQPDLAIATLNDFVEVHNLLAFFSLCLNVE